MEVPLKHQYSFQTIFNYIKKSLRIKNSRKTSIDSQLKKAKGKFHKAVHDSLKLCLNLVVKRLPQKYITNITIEFNQKNLPRKISEIYEEFNIMPSLEEIEGKNLFRKDKEKGYFQIMKNSFQDLYEIYLLSKRFTKDLEKVEKREGKKLQTLYQFVAKNFIKYYLYNKAHSHKNRHNRNEKKNLFIVYKSLSQTEDNLFD